MVLRESFLGGGGGLVLGGGDVRGGASGAGNSGGGLCGDGGVCDVSVASVGGRSGSGADRLMVGSSAN